MLYPTYLLKNYVKCQNRKTTAMIDLQNETPLATADKTPFEPSSPAANNERWEIPMNEFNSLSFDIKLSPLTLT